MKFSLLKPNNHAILKIMFKKVLVISFLAALLLMVPAMVKANNSPNKPKRIVTVAKDEVITKAIYINAGDQVEFAGDTEGDVYVAGGRVLVSGRIGGDLLAAGGIVDVTGDVAQNVRVVGGQVTISGHVGRNLSSVGGNLNLLKTAVVDGSVVLAGGNILLEAPVAGDLDIAAGNISIDTKIAGNLTAYTESLQLLSNSDVLGDLSYYSANEAMFSQGATVSGTITRHAMPEGAKMENLANSQQLASSLAKLKLQFKFFSFLIAMVFGIALMKLFPNYMSSVSERINAKFWQSAGIGFLVLFLTPLLIILLFITVLGIPFAIIFGFVYGLYLYMAKIYISYWIGRNLLSKWTKGWNSHLVFAFGLALYYVVTMIPILGGIIGFVAVLAGLGASLISCRIFYLKAYKSKLV